MYQVTQNKLKTFKSYYGGYKANIRQPLKRTTSEERTKAAVPKRPLFGGSTVIIIIIGTQ